MPTNQDAYLTHRYYLLTRTLWFSLDLLFFSRIPNIFKQNKQVHVLPSLFISRLHAGGNLWIWTVVMSMKVAVPSVVYLYQSFDTETATCQNSNTLLSFFSLMVSIYPNSLFFPLRTFLLLLITPSILFGLLNCPFNSPAPTHMP